MYSVEVYDIESDGGVSSVPALAGEMVTVYGPYMVGGPYTTEGPYRLDDPYAVDGPSSVYRKHIGYNIIIYNHIHETRDGFKTHTSLL